jgi:predicted amidohydrolase YtcJ
MLQRQKSKSARLAAAVAATLGGVGTLPVHAQDQYVDESGTPLETIVVSATRRAANSSSIARIDAPITPLAPLFTAWCAVNRVSASGRVLGEAERLTVADALRAITLGAAYTLKLDGEIGSIECGKRADFCVLDEDPLAVPSLALKDLPVWGVVQDGRVFAAADLPSD